MPTSKITLRQLIEKAHGEFRIPAYQRRYVWGQVRPGEKNAAAYLTECLLQAQEQSSPLFLQGLTISLRHGACSLVDGQQRITYLYLLLKYLEAENTYFSIRYAWRPEAENWLAEASKQSLDQADSDTQDIHFFKRTLLTLREISPQLTADFVLDNCYFLCIELDDPAHAVGVFEMMNGTKAPMKAPDIIKADMMRLASDATQPYTTPWALMSLRTRYATEWESWQRWWCADAVVEYYDQKGCTPLDLLLRLCLRPADADLEAPLTYEEFRQYIIAESTHPYHAAKHLFHKLRSVQKHFEQAFATPETYNRVRAILLLQEPAARLRFLHSMFVGNEIDKATLVRYYKCSFLGMTIDEIMRQESYVGKFNDLLDALSQADVYHSEAKKDVFNLLLRLNIDEDIKLGRKFDFSIWNNRSLEHIYSKSKVWHYGPKGKILDGNDNELPYTDKTIRADQKFLCRSKISAPGLQLSEHCIGNLVLLYGQNNASFGNATFAEKKVLFLTPGSMGVFQSRNLLHSVCVFAGNAWTARSIVDNYLLTLKNLRLYYGIE